ncbi:MAG: hypothetical protein R3Y13_05990 [bacterium]
MLIKVPDINSIKDIPDTVSNYFDYCMELYGIFRKLCWKREYYVIRDTL